MKKSALIRVIIFFLISAGICVGIIVTPKEEISYDENRVLAEMPEFSFESYKSGSFMTDFESWLSDHFVLREQFIRLRNEIEKLSGRSVIGGVYTADDMMIQLFEPNDEITEKNAGYINAFAKNRDNVYCLIAPTAQEIYKDKLPGYLDISDEGDYISKFYGGLENVKSIDVTDALRAERDGYIYFRTDHHWTTDGAFAAYRELAEAMGFECVPESEFTRQPVTDSFRGTLYSKTLDKSVTPDSISLYRFAGDDKLTADGAGYYHREFLEQKDKYSVFAGGNRGIVNVTGGRGDKRLLLIKDSYANSVVPFLSENYGEITMVDLRYASVGQLGSLGADGFDDILILYNASGFSGEMSVAKILNIK